MTLEPLHFILPVIKLIRLHVFRWKIYKNMVRGGEILHHSPASAIN